MKIGLLPLYIALYDRTSPSMRPRLEAFYQEIAQEFARRGVEVETSPFCRLKPEFEQAVGKFEAAGVDALVTLHMAYSPSLESIDVLAGTALPIVVLDTTETLEFTNGRIPWRSITTTASTASWTCAVCSPERARTMPSRLGITGIPTSSIACAAMCGGEGRRGPPRGQGRAGRRGVRRHGGLPGPL